MLNPNHEYDIHINESCPLAQQPEKVKIPMKPHQLASLHKVILMETIGNVMYHASNPELYLPRYSTTSHIPSNLQFRNKFQIQTNVGVLGDAIGSGKTILALSIIAAIPTSHIHKRQTHIRSYQSRTGAYLRGITEYVETTETNKPKLKTTLIVVPRGPVYAQFQNAINEQTTLNVLCIDSITVIKKTMPKADCTEKDLQEFIERYDAVLIKNTALKTLHEYYTSFTYQNSSILMGWERIIVDESCDILNTIPMMSYSFMWMISATYMYILGVSMRDRYHLSYSIRDVLMNDESVNLALVKCTDNFISKSFNVPPPIESYYVCELPRQLAAVHSFLSPSVRERIDGNDLMGALALMGASEQTENDIVKLVTKEIERDIRNREREINYINGLDIPDDMRTARLVTPTTDLARLNEKLKNLVERVSALEEKQCTICMDALENPLLLPCSHLYCAQCLISWMRFNHNTCPTCRASIQSRQLISIVKEKQEKHQNTNEMQKEDVLKIYPKEDTMINIIQANPTGKFVVFSKLDSSYWGITSRLRETGISYSLLRGNSNVMKSVLDRFNAGNTRVLLLNTIHAASGIDISCATDLIIIHDLGQNRTQAVGRCNRHPRSTPLRIHQLCFPHEMHEVPNSTASSSASTSTQTPRNPSVNPHEHNHEHNHEHTHENLEDGIVENTVTNE